MVAELHDMSAEISSTGNRRCSLAMLLRLCSLALGREGRGKLAGLEGLRGICLLGLLFFLSVVDQLCEMRHTLTAHNGQACGTSRPRAEAYCCRLRTNRAQRGAVVAPYEAWSEPFVLWFV